MNFNLIITGGIYSTQAAYSAIQFCRAAIKSGHSITQVFFYQDGVTQGNRLSVPLADEFDCVSQWSDLGKEFGISLIVCVSAAERRGVMNAEQADEYSLSAFNLHPDFSVAGLGELTTASLSADRTISFK